MRPCPALASDPSGDAPPSHRSAQSGGRPSLAPRFPVHTYPIMGSEGERSPDDRRRFDSATGHSRCRAVPNGAMQAEQAKHERNLTMAIGQDDTKGEQSAYYRPVGIKSRLPTNTTPIQEYTLLPCIRNPDIAIGRLSEYLGVRTEYISQPLENLAIGVLGHSTSSNITALRGGRESATNLSELTEKQRAVVETVARYPDAQEERTLREVARGAMRVTGVQMSETNPSNVYGRYNDIIREHHNDLVEQGIIPEGGRSADGWPFEDGATKPDGVEAVGDGEPLLKKPGVDDTPREWLEAADVGKLPDENLDTEVIETGETIDWLETHRTRLRADGYNIDSEPETVDETEPEEPEEDTAEQDDEGGSQSADGGADTGDGTTPGERTDSRGRAVRAFSETPTEPAEETNPEAATEPSGETERSVGNRTYRGPEAGLDTTSGRGTSHLSDIGASQSGEEPAAADEGNTVEVPPDDLYELLETVEEIREYAEHIGRQVNSERDLLMEQGAGETTNAAAVTARGVVATRVQVLLNEAETDLLPDEDESKTGLRRIEEMWRSIRGSPEGED